MNSMEISNDNMIVVNNFNANKSPEKDMTKKKNNNFIDIEPNVVNVKVNDKKDIGAVTKDKKESLADDSLSFIFNLDEESVKPENGQ